VVDGSFSIVKLAGLLACRAGIWYNKTCDLQGSMFQGRIGEELEESEVVIMYRIAIIIVIGLAVCGAGDVQATMINFYVDGVIQDGDEYTVAQIFDEATVDMVGGVIETRVWVNDSGTFNIFNGALDGVDIILGDEGTFNIWNGVRPDGSLRFELARIWGGSSSSINVYGYGFERAGYNLYGHWADDTPFYLYIRDDQSWSNTTLHVVPEPTTVMMLIVGGLIVRKRES